MIDCEVIEGDWSDQADNMTLAIQGTSTPDIYEASFDFGIIEGLMILSPDEGALERCNAYAEDSDDEQYDEDEDGEDDEDEDDERRYVTGSKRKAASGRTSKKAKKGTGADRTVKFFFRMKSKDTNTWEINYLAEKGTIEFGGPDFAAFTGVTDMPWIGPGVSFTARKISSKEPQFWETWGDYSQAAYERARVGRWR